MKKYVEKPFSLNQSGASISLEPSLWTNQEPAFSGPFSFNQSGARIFFKPSLWANQEPSFSGPFSLSQSGAIIFLDQSEASIFGTIQPELIRSQHFSGPIRIQRLYMCCGTWKNSGFSSVYRGVSPPHPSTKSTQ